MGHICRSSDDTNSIFVPSSSLVHVALVTCLGFYVPAPLEMNIHTLEMPTKAGMRRGLFWPPMNLLEMTVSPLLDTGGAIGAN